MTRPESRYALTSTPSIQQLGELVSDAVNLFGRPSSTFFLQGSNATLGKLTTEAPSFRLKGRIAPTRLDKQYGWYGDLLDRAHQLLRLKGAQANTTFMSEDNDFYKQLGGIESNIKSTEFTEKYKRSLEVILGKTSDNLGKATQTSDKTPLENTVKALERIKKMLQSEITAVDALLTQRHSDNVSVLFLWQRLLGQQKIFVSSNSAGIPIDLMNDIHNLTHSDFPEQWQKSLKRSIDALPEAHISLKKLKNNEVIHLKIHQGGENSLAMTMIGLFAGRVLQDPDRIPKPLRNLLENIGNTNQITQK